MTVMVMSSEDLMVEIRCRMSTSCRRRVDFMSTDDKSWDHSSCMASVGSLHLKTVFPNLLKFAMLYSF